MSGAPDLICVGHVVSEMIYFTDEIKGPVLGSPPAYCSVAAAVQGRSTGIVTKIGNDMPKHLLEPISACSVDTAGVRVGGRTTRSELIYDGEGGKEIRYPTKADPITAGDLPSAYHGCKLIYICTMDSDVLPADIPAITALGETTAVDVGGYGGAHMSKLNRAAVPSLPELACRVAGMFDIVKASDEDAMIIFGKDDPEESALKFLAAGARVVLITLGSSGVLVAIQEEITIVPPLPCRPIDTTGGGDTFMAGFLSEYLSSEDPVRAARWGAATAACVIEKTGGVLRERMPDFNTVEERFEGGRTQWQK